MCDCNYFVCVIATRSYLWLQHDCVCVVKAAWLFGYLWLQAWTVCVCKYFVFVIATRTYLWLQHDYVCVVKDAWLFWLFMIASLSSMWLQQLGRCDWKKHAQCFVLQLFCVCHCKHSHGTFCDCKKRLNSVCLQLFCVCVIATQTYLWLQHDCVCVVKATWLFGYLWLQAWVVCDCKSRFVVIAKKHAHKKNMHCVFFFKLFFCVCHCKHRW
jgi:hypothetical protein